MNETKEINFHAEKTEAEWSKAMDKWFLYAAPTWFEWLKWIIIIGAVQIVASKTQDRLVQLILSTSYWFLAFYLMAFFYQFEFHGLPLIKSDKKRRTASLIISAILALGIYLTLVHISHEMQI